MFHVHLKRMCILITPYERNIITSTRLTAVLTLITWLPERLSGFSTAKVLLSLPSALCFMGEESLCGSRVRSRDSCSTSFEGYCFFIQFDNLCLLIWMFRPFIMIIDIVRYIFCYLYSVFLTCSWFLLSSFFLPLFEFVGWFFSFLSLLAYSVFPILLF